GAGGAEGEGAGWVAGAGVGNGDDRQILRQAGVGRRLPAQAAGALVVHRHRPGAGDRSGGADADVAEAVVAGGKGRGLVRSDSKIRSTTHDAGGCDKAVVVPELAVNPGTPVGITQRRRKQADRVGGNAADGGAAQVPDGALNGRVDAAGDVPVGCDVSRIAAHRPGSGPIAGRGVAFEGDVVQS